jgi:hypothetical protein
MNKVAVYDWDNLELLTPVYALVADVNIESGRPLPVLRVAAVSQTKRVRNDAEKKRG